MPFYNYALSKYIFTKKSLEIAKKNKVKCRVLKLFHVYGKNENMMRLWPSLINAAKKNKNFYMNKKVTKLETFVILKMLYYH